jgi:hypothetical protein
MTDNSTELATCARCKQMLPASSLHEMWQAPFFVVKLFTHIPADYRLFCRSCSFRLNALVITALLALVAVVTTRYWIHYLDEVFKWIA